ncbi:MAG: hypothetical protein GF313_14955 [Caldithrix sp.]|nr:hypothetical protein [Caldithrix sp.]
MLRLSLPLMFILIVYTSAFGQAQSWTFVTYEDQPYSEVVLYQVSADSLYVKAFGKIHAVHIDSIKYMKRKRESYAGRGFITGMITGGVLANRIAVNSGYENGFLGGFAYGVEIIIGTAAGIIGGGILGYALGSGFSKDEFYDFSTRNLQEKKTLLTKLLNRSYGDE